jgi:CheY-like chemotaxis protein
MIQTGVDGVRKTASNGNAVLVVDDDGDLRESLGDVLRAEGYAVTLASNGREALALLPSLRRPCAVVLDLTEPFASGTAFYQAMIAVPALADIPVVGLAGDPSVAPGGVPRMEKINLERLLTLVGALF